MQWPDFLGRSPFARLLLFFVAGILLSLNLEGRQTPVMLILLLTLAILMLLLLIVISRAPNFHTGLRSGVISSLLLFLLGFVNSNLSLQHHEKAFEKNDYPGFFLMDITDIPEVLEKSVRTFARVSVRKHNGEWIPTSDKVLVYFEKDSTAATLPAGSRILARGALKPIHAADNPFAFDYRKYLANRGFYHQLYLPHEAWTIIPYKGIKPVRAYAQLMQQQLLETYRLTGMDRTRLSLLSALTLGYKNDLEANTRQLFAEAGVMHVMALSGFNVAVIVLALSMVLCFCNRSLAGRIFRAILIIATVWMFAFVTGLSPSVTRASVMVTFLISGKTFNQEINTYNILFATAFFVLLISPALIADVSFQLSFAAVLGILILHPPLFSLLSFKNRLAKSAWQLFTVSCAAQLSTMPLTLFYFHQFPVYFWLTNMYVIPLVSVIIWLAVVFLVVSFITPLMTLLGKILSWLVFILYESVAITEKLPFSLIENIHVNAVQSVLLFSLVVSFALLLMHRRMSHLWLFLSLLVIFELSSLQKNVSWHNQRAIMVGALRNHPAIHLVEGRKAVFVTDQPVSFNEAQVRYAFDEYWIRSGVKENLQVQLLQNTIPDDTGVSFFVESHSSWLGRNRLFHFCNKRIIVLQDNCIYRVVSDLPLNADMVIVSGNIGPDLISLHRVLDPAIIVTDSSVKYYSDQQWKKACEEAGVAFWSVNRQGAFEMRMK